MWILDCDPKKIENPHKNPYNLAETQSRDIELFEDGIEAILSHAHEIDIDKNSEEWFAYRQNWDSKKFHSKDEIDRYNSFSQFLQDKLKQESKR